MFVDILACAQLSVIADQSGQLKVEPVTLVSSLRMIDSIQQGLFSRFAGQPWAYPFSHRVVIALAQVLRHGRAQRIHLRPQRFGDFPGSELFE